MIDKYNCSTKFKEALRELAARTVPDLFGAMGDALRRVTPEDIVGWFRHSGYGPAGSTARLIRKTL